MWSINNELIFTSYQTSGTRNDFEHENQYTITYTEIGYSYLKLSNMLRFNYPVGSMLFNLNAGISHAIAISETNYRKTESRFFTTENMSEGKAIEGTRSHELGFIVGLGTKFKRYSLDIRYERGNGMSDSHSLNSPTRRFYLFLRYRLK